MKKQPLLFLVFGWPYFLFAQEKMSSEQLLEDFGVAKQAFLELHPGLYKYQDAAALQAHFDRTEAALQTDLTLGEAFLVFSKFAAGIKCGHSYTNPWNQPAKVKKALFEQADKVPFTFSLAGDRMVVQKDLTPEKQLGEGNEVVAINGVPMGDLLRQLLPYVSTDGTNEAKCWSNLQLSGTGDHETFDKLFPLLLPPENGQYVLSLREIGQAETRTETVQATSRAERKAAIVRAYGPQPEGYDDLWSWQILDGQTGYLRLGTFVTWKMEMNWKKWMADTFAAFEKAGVKAVIIDIRDNGGGNSEVSKELGRYILAEPLTITGQRTQVAFRAVPAELRPYLTTWDKKFYEAGSKGKPLPDGGFEVSGQGKRPRTFRPTGKHFPADYYLLVNGSNSSATFSLAQLMKENGLATLVGQPTGGNYRGTNGGAMFFLTLPNTGIEMDIPIYGYYPLQPQPDAGVEPDVVVVPTAEELAAGQDVVLQKTQQLIAGQQAGQ